MELGAAGAGVAGVGRSQKENGSRFQYIQLVQKLHDMAKARLGKTLTWGPGEDLRKKDKDMGHGTWDKGVVHYISATASVKCVPAPHPCLPWLRLPVLPAPIVLVSKRDRRIRIWFGVHR